MSNATIGPDAFARSVEQILGRVSEGVRTLMPEAVEGALKVGEDAWKRNAKAVLSSSYSRGGWGRVKPNGITYFKSGARKGQVKSIRWYGKVFKTGRYANSIRHHMISSGGDTPDGEIGSSTMPGLAHLLEKGHASVGGGYVPAHEHIAPAAEEAFARFERLAEQVVDRAINDA